MTIEDVESEWMLPDFDPAVDVLLVFEDDHAIASAEVPGWRAEAKVHPNARGRGSVLASAQDSVRREVSLRRALLGLDAEAPAVSPPDETLRGR